MSCISAEVRDSEIQADGFANSIVILAVVNRHEKREKLDVKCLHRR